MICDAHAATRKVEKRLVAHANGANRSENLVRSGVGTTVRYTLFVRYFVCHYESCRANELLFATFFE